MSRPIMLVVHSSITYEHLDQISTKYHLVEEDGAVFPGSTTVIDRPPSSIVGFYLYYFEVGLRVPPCSFFGSIIESYRVHTCQLKTNSILKVVCFELLFHASLVVPTIDLFHYFFRICSNDAWY